MTDHLPSSTADRGTPSPEVTRRIRRRWPVITGAVGMGVALLLGLVFALRETPGGIDQEWMDELLEERAPWFDVPALFMDWIGGHIVGVVIVPVAMVIWLIALRRPWAAGYSLIAAIISAGIVQLLKVSFGRARPDDILVLADEGSFPSGHVANAATIAVVLALVFGRESGRRWVWVAGTAYVVAMALSRTYLGAHWLSDTIGGALLGAGVAVALWAPVAHRLVEEPRPRRERLTPR